MSDADRVLPSDLEAFRRVVRVRRSVRKFDGARLPREVVEDCLDLALLAPNSSNLQPWEFVWVHDAAKRAALAEACFSQGAATTAGELIAIVARPGLWRRHCREILARWPGGKPPRIARAYYEKIAPLMYTQGPFGIAAWIKRPVFWAIGLFRPAPRFPHGRAQLREWAVKSATFAGANLMLALVAHGYDTCPMEGFDEARVRRILALPRGATVAMIVAAGRRLPEGVYGEQFRFPRAEVVREV